MGFKRVHALKRQRVMKKPVMSRMRIFYFVLVSFGRSAPLNPLLLLTTTVHERERADPKRWRVS